MLGLGVRTSGASSDYYTRDTQGNPLSQRTGSTREYYAPDALGSIVRTVDGATNATTSTAACDPDGNTTTSTGTSTNPLGYTGGYKAPGGLYHYGQRYYDPADARWTQPDPLNQPADLVEGNGYVYAGADPVTNFDPSGRFSIGFSATAWLGICLKAHVSVGSHGASAGSGSGVGLQASVGPSISSSSPHKTGFTNTITDTACDDVCGSIDSHGNESLGVGGLGASLTDDESVGIGF